MNARLDVVVHRAARTEVATDATLVAAARGGSQQAFSELVLRYRAPVCSFAYALTGSLGHSDEIAQETLLVAWRRLGGMQRPDRFRGWVFGIARKLCSESRRSERRQWMAAVAAPLGRGAEAPGGEPSPLDRMITREEERVLSRILEQIPETYRLPLVLYYREDESIETVAQILAVSAASVHQRLSRGRKMLREHVAFVASALKRTRPGKALTAAVVARISLA